MSALDTADRLLGSSGARRRGAGILLSLVSLALVTGAIYAFKAFVPVLSLGVLYVFAVLPVAVLFGRAYAIPVALFALEGDAIAGIVGFADAALFERLGLPTALEG